MVEENEKREMLRGENGSDTARIVLNPYPDPYFLSGYGFGYGYLTDSKN
jgi:hypothetical protein